MARFWCFVWDAQWVFKWTYLCLLLRIRTLSTWWCKFTDANTFSAWNNASKIAEFFMAGQLWQTRVYCMVPTRAPAQEWYCFIQTVFISAQLLDFFCRKLRFKVLLNDKEWNLSKGILSKCRWLCLWVLFVVEHRELKCTIWNKASNTFVRKL